MPPLSRRDRGLLLGGVALLALCACAAVGGSRGWLHLRDLRRQQEELEVLAVRLERDNRRLRDHLDRLARDDAYVERLARERLGWVGAGERVYRVERGVLAGVRGRAAASGSP
jgi:cell division protein FtsB